MKKTYIYSIVTSIIVVSSSSVVLAAQDYDALVNELANNILTQIQNDVPPVETTGTDNTGGNELPADTTAGLLGTVFTKTDRAFELTSLALNDRLNGGVLSKDTQDAIDYLYQQKLTKFNTPVAFQSDSPLRRDEAAKFFALFAKQVTKKLEDSSKKCEFKDLAEGHTDLADEVVASCMLGIFRGTNGYFNPTKALTNGEALTVLMRIIYGNMDETDADHRAKNYRSKAQTYGLTQGSLMDSMKYLDTPITRGDIARLLEGARFIPTIKLALGGDISYSLASQGFILIK